MNIITVDYFPKMHRINFLDTNGMACGGIMGDRAHVKAAELMLSNHAIVRICGINSKMNKRLNKARSHGKTDAILKSLNIKS